MHSIKRAHLPPLIRRTQPTLTTAPPFLPHQTQHHHIHSSTSKPQHTLLTTHFPPPLRPQQSLSHPPRLPPRFRTFATNPRSPNNQDPPPPTPYTYQTLAPLTASPSPNRLIIDVREPAELADTGRIPSAVSMPITSNPDAFYLSSEEFFERFGFEKPVSSRSRKSGGQQEGEGGDGGIDAGNPYTETLKRREAGAGLNGGDAVAEEAGEEERDPEGGVEEVIFYCKAGVRSRAAARMAREWQGVKVGDMKGGWMEWSANGGQVER